MVWTSKNSHFLDPFFGGPGGQKKAVFLRFRRGVQKFWSASYGPIFGKNSDFGGTEGGYGLEIEILVKTAFFDVFDPFLALFLRGQKTPLF